MKICPVKRHKVIQPLDQSYRFIPLTQGQNAIVDAVDFEWLSKWNWYAGWNGHTESFYAVRNSTVSEGIKRTQVRMHRLILHCEQGEEGDHWNHNTLDNRRENLRKCKQQQNAKNAKRRKDNLSGFKGVHFCKPTGKWIAQISAAGTGKSQYIGSFDSPKIAARAYDNAAKKFHGKFALLNFPN